MENNLIDAETFKKLQPKEYMRRFVTKNCRPDGRGFLESRQLDIRVDVISTAVGSSQVSIGDTLVTCGIKAEITKPTLESPTEGIIISNIDLSPLCHPRYKPGPPHEQTQFLTEYLYRINNKTPLINVKDLCIVENVAVWVLYVDIICLNYDGNVWDAIMIAFATSLKTMKIPKAELNQETGVIIASSTEFYQFEMLRMPLSLSFGIFDGILIIDPTDAEEMIIDDLIIVTIDKSNSLCAFLKQGGVLEKETLQQCLSLTKKKLKEVRKLIDSVV